jgi:DNA modification methylase
MEPFGGSGSTLMAAHKLSRKCFVMEKTPLYCDVILARWKKYTGSEPELVKNGKKEKADGEKEGKQTKEQKERQ